MTPIEATEKQLSKVEGIKENSQGLAGQIVETMTGGATHYEEAEYQLLKFHGSYQQDDRDLRVERSRQKLEKAWMFMVRCKIPGGLMTAEQYLAMDDICEHMGNKSLR